MSTSFNPPDVPQLKVGRDVHGRFTKANPGGPGNPFARKVAALRKTLLDSVSDQDLKDIIEALKLKARQGDMAAIKLLLQYCVGKPESPKDPDRMDVDEWRRLQEMRVGGQVLVGTIEDVPACLACHVAEEDWPCKVQQGPLDGTVYYIHAQLQPGSPSAEPGDPAKATQDGARADTAPARTGAAAVNQTETSNAPAEPAAPTPERPSPAKPTSKSNDRRDPAGPSGDDRRSPTQPPSPNGGNGEQQPQGLKPPPRPSQPSGQAQRKPRR